MREETPTGRERGGGATQKPLIIGTLYHSSSEFFEKCRLDNAFTGTVRCRRVVPTQQSVVPLPRAGPLRALSELVAVCAAYCAETETTHGCPESRAANVFTYLR